MSKTDYPKYIVRKRDKAIWVRYKNTNRYQREFIPELKNRQPPYDWWTYELLTEKFDFFPIENDQYTMYNELHEKFCKAVYGTRRQGKGCGWEIDD